MKTFISKFATIPPNKQVVTKERLRLTLTVMVIKTTLPQDFKIFISTCWLLVNYPQLLKQNIYFVFMFVSLAMEYLCKCTMHFFKNTSLLTGGCSTHITSAGARTGIVRCPDGHQPIWLKIFESFWRLSDIVRCPDGHRWNRTIWILNKNRPVPVRCV